MKLSLKQILAFVATLEATTFASGKTTTSTSQASTGKAQEIEVIDNLGATIKGLLLNGNGALVIDGIILAGAAYGTAVTKSPAPIVCGLVSCAVFHMATKLLMS